MNGPLALVDLDPEDGFNVLDARDGQPIAWRFQLGEAAAVASRLNASYPPGAPAPAHDSLVFEAAMERIAGEPVLPLSRVDWRGMIPDAIDDRPALWKP